MLRLMWVTAGLAALGCLAGGCASSGRRWSIVALGDSVPRGTNCDCTPYPELSARDLAASSGHGVSATNDAVNGATTASVLSQVDSDKEVMRAVRGATAIEIEVGANDVSQTSSCGTAVDCYAPQLSPLQKNLQAIVARARELTSGHRVVVVLLDYWNVWLGGRYAAAQGPAYVSAADEVTAEVDAIIKATAAETDSDYVDLRAAFKGPNYAYDETQYLAPDGDHPNAAGHKQIAKAVDGVLERALG
jgi:acyl-CoA thioesterase I